MGHRVCRQEMLAARRAEGRARGACWATAASPSPERLHREAGEAISEQLLQRKRLCGAFRSAICWHLALLPTKIPQNQPGCRSPTAGPLCRDSGSLGPHRTPETSLPSGRQTPIPSPCHFSSRSSTSTNLSTKISCLFRSMPGLSQPRSPAKQLAGTLLPKLSCLPLPNPAPPTTPAPEAGAAHASTGR